LEGDAGGSGRSLDRRLRRSVTEKREKESEAPVHQKIPNREDPKKNKKKGGSLAGLGRDAFPDDLHEKISL